jgi:hypothetical protein
MADFEGGAARREYARAPCDFDGAALIAAAVAQPSFWPSIVMRCNRRRRDNR